MNKKWRFFLTFFVLFTSGTPMICIHANESVQEVLQTRRISGTIVDSKGEPIIGANVKIVGGHGKGTITNQEGKFSLNIPMKTKLIVSYVGYITKTVEVTNSKMSITLQEDSKMLGEVEITAEFGMKRVARSVGSDAQNVKAADIIDSGRGNFITALQGRVSGIDVTSTSGIPGASTTVTLRSLTSISGNNQPLYVIDGVPMNNSTFDPNTFADAGSNFSVRNLDFSSRGNDFNPEDIESLTVLKGAAAAALYGSDASNGAIIITTKKGRPGQGRVSYSNSFSFSRAYGYPKMQNKYAEGAYGTTNYYYTSRYGGLYPEGTKFYDNIGSVLHTGFSQEHNASIETGTDKATLRAGISFLDNQGVVKTSDYKRMNLTLSGQAQITKWLKFEGSMQYTSTKNHKVLNGTSGPLYLAMRWPMVDDMSDYMNSDGSHMRYPNYYTDTDLLNPLFGMHKNKFYDISDRILSYGTITITPTKHTFLRAQAGWDVGAQTFEASVHPYYAAANGGVGSYNIAKVNFNDPTLNILAGYNNSFLKDKLSLGVQVGYHQVEDGNNDLATYGTKFEVIDFQSINNCDPSTITSSKHTTKRRVQAISTQVELGWNNLAFLTLRSRNDWSSTLPVNNRHYFYPAAEASVVLSDLPFLKNNPVVNYLKLRSSVAQVGKDASPLSINPQLEATGLTGGGYQYGYTGPNKKLKPEMTTSWEAGLEGRFMKDRIVADFTYFRTHCSKQIVNGFRLSYATGFVLNNMNVGTFNTWGWEGHIDGDIISNDAYKFRWNVGLNMSHSGSKVVYLPPNVSEYYNAYTWNSGNLRNGIMVGHPVTTITGLAYTRNSKGQKLISPTTGLPYVDSSWSVLGDREPMIRFGVTTAITYQDFRLSAMFTGRYHATVVNGTKRSMMSAGTSWESVRLREKGPVVFNGVLKDGNEETSNPTPNNISVSYKDYGSSIYSGNDEDWLEKNVNYLHLSELRLSYTAPTKVLKSIFNGFISHAVVYVSGNDLLTWTNYSGIDAVGNTVSAAAGGTGGEGYDVWSLPNPRTFSFGVSLTF